MRDERGEKKERVVQILIHVLKMVDDMGNFMPKT